MDIGHLIKTSAFRLLPIIRVCVFGVCLVLQLISCSADDSSSIGLSESDYVLLNVRLNPAASVASRAAIPDDNLMQDITSAKSWTCDWERNIKRVRIFIFKAGTLIYNELTDNITSDNIGYYDKIKIKVPTYSTLTVYAVINEADQQTAELEAVTAEVDLETVKFKMSDKGLGYLFRSGSYYRDFNNGNYEFTIPMYGKADVTVGGVDLSTNLTVTRTVARVDLYFSDALSGTYDTKWASAQTTTAGKVTTSLELKNVVDEGLLLPARSNVSHSDFKALPYRSSSYTRGWGANTDERVWTFYLPEQELSGTDRVGIRFTNLVFDSSNTNVYTPWTCEFEMNEATPDAGGAAVPITKVTRNAVYKIHITFIDKEIKFKVHFSLWNEVNTPIIYL